MDFEIRALSGVVPAVFARMAPKAVAPHLQNLKPDGPILAVAAYAGGAPAGLGVARAGEPAEVLSLFVLPPLWRRGLGTALLQALEGVLEKRRCPRAFLRYSTETPSHVAVERILAKRAWTAPVPRWRIAQIRSSVLDEAAWPKRRAPSKVEVFPWTGLTAAECASLHSIQQEITPALWPFTDPTPPDPQTSVGARANGEVIGWMITNRVAPQVMRFAILYTRDRWRSPGVTFHLLTEAGRRMRATYGPEMVASLAVQVENEPMLRVLERKFRPWAALWAEMRSSDKSLV